MNVYSVLTMMLVLMLIITGCSSAPPPVAAPALTDQPTEQLFTLDSLDQVQPINLEATAVEYQARKAIKVNLEGSGYLGLAKAWLNGNKSLAMLPVTFRNGTIEADLAGEADLQQDPDSRGFVGIAFRAKADASQYEAFYFRVTNGNNAVPKPDADRLKHAVQYISIPDWDFDRFRAEFPDQYEKGANVAPETWFHIRIEVDGATASVFVNDETTAALTVNDLKMGADAVGQIGLWTGIASAGYFSNVKVTHR